MTTMKWQTIDTAPKDGTDILVYDDSDMAGGHVDIACWRRDCWVNYEGFPVLPTHWMPLPEPPSESSAQVKREPPKGCRSPLAKGQYWAFCGETDMGQTDPALCTECGGEFKRRAE